MLMKLEMELFPEKLAVQYQCSLLSIDTASLQRRGRSVINFCIFLNYTVNLRCKKHLQGDSSGIGEERSIQKWLGVNNFSFYLYIFPPDSQKSDGGDNTWGNQLPRPASELHVYNLLFYIILHWQTFSKTIKISILTCSFISKLGVLVQGSGKFSINQSINYTKLFG